MRQQTVSLPAPGEAVTDHDPVTESGDAAEYPITENLVEAFCTAILAFNDWKQGDPEPHVFLDGKFLPVSEIANVVSASNDPMPDGINDFLCRVIGAGNAPTDCTFAAAGTSLYRSRAAYSARISMPLPREVQFLRERAKRLREMADENQTALSDRLRMMAHELEARADELERAGADNGGGSQ
jgi:hypothetical protein